MLCRGFIVESTELFCLKMSHMLTTCVCFLAFSAEASFCHICLCHLCLCHLCLCYLCHCLDLLCMYRFCHCHHAFISVHKLCQGEPRVCSTPPPGISLSATTAKRITRTSTSTESEFLDKIVNWVTKVPRSLTGWIDSWHRWRLRPMTGLPGLAGCPVSWGRSRRTSRQTTRWGLWTSPTRPSRSPSCWHRETSRGSIWTRGSSLTTGRSSWMTDRSSWTACSSRWSFSRSNYSSSNFSSLSSQTLKEGKYDSDINLSDFNTSFAGIPHVP